MSAPVYLSLSPSNILPQLSVSNILQDANPLSFHKGLENYAPTPLHILPQLSLHLGIKQVYIKDESFRFGLNAFKALGASFAVNQLLLDHPQTEIICTATDGNHGRAVAWSANRMGKKSVVFVPQGTARARIQAIENEGATVYCSSGHYDDACREALEYSNKHHALLIQDTAWPGYEDVPAYVMAGYFTHFHELEDSLHTMPLPEVDIVFLQAGVGTWAAAAVWYYLNRYGADRPKIVLVEPFASDGIFQSFQTGARSLPSGNQNTIMAGLNCGIPSLTAWEILKSGCDFCMSIHDHHVEHAMRTLYRPIENDSRIISGESGAAGMAALLAVVEDPDYSELKNHLNIDRESRILIFNTEGDTDPMHFQKIVG